MKTLTEEIATLKIGEPTAFRNLTLFPLLREEPKYEEPEYLLLEDAIARGLASVTELNGGTVPELQFENRADKPVLLVDGEELVGAKQNRVLNLTILAPARKKLVIPVACVEAGRWQMQSPDFKPANYVMYAMGRAARAEHVTESMRTTGTRRANQSSVWADIASKMARMEAPSPTQRMSAAYERYAVSMEEYVRAFSWQPRQTGVVFVIEGATAGADVFDHPVTMNRFLPKLLRSYALDAIDAAARKGSETGLDAGKLLSLVSAARTCSEDAIGLGKDIRLLGNDVSGGALWANDRYVHVCAFVSGNGSGSPKVETRINRPTFRFRR